MLLIEDSNCGRFVTMEHEADCRHINLKLTTAEEAVFCVNTIYFVFLQNILYDIIDTISGIGKQDMKLFCIGSAKIHLNQLSQLI